MREHLEIRNRQHLKRKFLNCFVGSEATSWLLSASYAATRKEAEEIGEALRKGGYIRHVTDGHTFKDAFLYYRFTEDEPSVASLKSLCAGRGRDDLVDMANKSTNSTNSGFATNSQEQEATYESQCPFRFAPHTAHNSLVLSLKFAREIEKAFSLNGTSKQKRNAILELRQRVRREASKSSPNWQLRSERRGLDGEQIRVYRKSHIRGDFTTTKTCGTIEISPIDFLEGFLSFDRRKQWEEYFNEGVVVDSLLAPVNKQKKEKDDNKSDRVDMCPNSMSTRKNDEMQFDHEKTEL